jgi:uncharacterized protein YgbK (DUF1537 family)
MCLRHRPELLSIFFINAQNADKMNGS